VGPLFHRRFTVLTGTTTNSAGRMNGPIGLERMEPYALDQYRTGAA